MHAKEEEAELQGHRGIFCNEGKMSRQAVNVDTVAGEAWSCGTVYPQRCDEHKPAAMK